MGALGVSCPPPPPISNAVLPTLRNAGKETEERGGRGGLDQVPFPPEDEDSDEDEDTESLPPHAQPQHKKQRVKASSSPRILGGGGGGEFSPKTEVPSSLEIP